MANVSTVFTAAGTFNVQHGSDADKCFRHLNTAASSMMYRASDPAATKDAYRLCEACHKEYEVGSGGVWVFIDDTPTDPAVASALATLQREADKRLNPKDRKSKEGTLRRLARETARAVGFDAVRDPNIPLAAWRFDAGSQTHRVRLNPDYAKCVTPGGDAATLAHNLLRHETAHGLFTTRDVDTLSRLLTAEDLSPSLFNLFEDCRIEARMADYDGEGFDWSSLAYNVTETDKPTAYLGAMLNESSPNPTRVKWTGSEEDRATIADYFHRLTATDADRLPSSFDVLPLMAEWKAQYGDEVERPAPSSGGGDGDALPGDPNGAAMARAKADAKGEDGDKAAKAKGEGEPSNAKASGAVDKDGNKMTGGYGYGGTGRQPHRNLERTVTQRDRNNPLSKGARSLPPNEKSALADFSPRTGYGPPKMDELPAIVAKLAGMMSRHNPESRATGSSGRGIYLRGALTGSAEAFTVTRGKGRGRKVVAIFDMSGSMGSDFYSHGAQFLAALLCLHRMGHIRLTPILSGGGMNALVPLTIGPEDLSALAANLGCESIDATLTAHRQAVIESDTVLIYTDGNLTDGDVEAGVWRSRGVDLVGVAVKPDTYKESTVSILSQHFARAIVEPTGTGLATRIAQYILTGR